VISLIVNGLAIDLIVEDVLAAIASTHGMVDGPGRFNPYLARRGSSILTYDQPVKSLL
jgi:hypothetical protein